MAKLAEQRLQQEGIPCLTRCLQGGPGLWGSAYNLPHGLYVYQADEMRAREVLDLLPQEIIERDTTGTGPTRRLSLWIVVLALGLGLAVIIAAPALWRLF